MSYIKNLSVQITPAQESAVENPIDAAIAAINAIQIVVLSPDERKDIPAVAEERLPYVMKAVNVLGPAYPALVSRVVTTPAATDALVSFTFLEGLLIKAKELQDRIADLSQNLQNTTYNYTLDLYDASQDHIEDIPGAQVVVEEIGPLFAGQGVPNPGVPTP